MLVDRDSIDGLNAFRLPFGYYLELGADLLILRRSEGSFVAAFEHLGRRPLRSGVGGLGGCRLAACGRCVEGYLPIGHSSVAARQKPNRSPGGGESD